MNNKTLEGFSTGGDSNISDSLKRYFVVLIDAATPDDDKIWQSVGVLASDEDAAVEIAQTYMEQECGDGYFPLLTLTETELSKLTAELNRAELSDKKPVICL